MRLICFSFQGKENNTHNACKEKKYRQSVQHSCPFSAVKIMQLIGNNTHQNCSIHQYHYRIKKRMVYFYPDIQQYRKYNRNMGHDHGKCKSEKERMQQCIVTEIIVNISGNNIKRRNKKPEISGDHRDGSKL